MICVSFLYMIVKLRNPDPSKRFPGLIYDRQRQIFVDADWSDHHGPNTQVYRPNLNLNIDWLRDLSIDNLKTHLSTILDRYRSIGRDLGLSVTSSQEILALFDPSVASRMFVDYCKLDENVNTQLGHMMLRQYNEVYILLCSLSI